MVFVYSYLGKSIAGVRLIPSIDRTEISPEISPEINPEINVNAYNIFVVFYILF